MGTIKKKSIIAALLFLLAPLSTNAIEYKGGPSEEFKIFSIILSKEQCNLLLPGFREKIAPYYLAWRKANHEIIAKVEGTKDFPGKIKEMKLRLPKLSDKAKRGATKDCAALLTNMAAEFPQQRPAQ